MFVSRNPLLMNPMLFRPNIPQPFIINSNKQPMPMRMPVPIVHQSPFIGHPMAMHPPSAMIGMVRMHQPSFIIPPNPSSIPRNIPMTGIPMPMQPPMNGMPPPPMMMNNRIVFNVHPQQMQNTFINNPMNNTLLKTNESIDEKVNEINGSNSEVIANVIVDNIVVKAKKKKQQILLYDNEDVSQEEARFACSEYAYHPPVKVVVRSDDGDEDIDVQNEDKD